MQALIHVIIPVFIVIGAGYAAVWFKWFSNDGVDLLMKFTQGFAIPCLLFSAVSELDLASSFNFPLLSSYYSGAASCFVVGALLAHFLFGRPWPDCVAIGFCCLFSNSVLLGLPITERAFGPDALDANYVIISVHAPIAYILGISLMECVRAEGKTAGETAKSIFLSLSTNALIIGLSLGFLVNFLNISVPFLIMDAVDLVARAALPAALFGLGGVLVNYRPEGDMRIILSICFISLILHPAIAWFIGQKQILTDAEIRSMIITSSMAPGINAYIFANMYGVAKRIAAASVLIATCFSIVTAAFWLSVLP